MTDRHVAVVLGMHRSGTSLLAGALSSLGVSLGTRLIEGDAHNQRGYFEHERIVALHKRLQEILDRRWTGPKGGLDYPPEWWLRPEVQQVESELAGIVASEAAGSQGMWGFKDPRTTRLLAMWKRIFRQLDLKPIYFLSVRNPSDVADSVAKRDGLSPARVHLLWAQHNLDALRELRGEPMHLIDFDRWFTDLPGQARRLVKALSLEADPAGREAEVRLASLVDPGMRHHRAERRQPTRFIQHLYAGLSQAAMSGTIPENLRQAEAELAAAKEILAGWGEVIEANTDPRAGAAGRAETGRRGKLARWLGAGLSRSYREPGD